MNKLKHLFLGAKVPKFPYESPGGEKKKSQKSNYRQNCEGNTALTVKQVNHIGGGAATWQEWPATAHFYGHCK